MFRKILNWLGIGPVPLTPATECRLDVLFVDDQRARAKELLIWMPSSLPKDPVALERVRFALLRLSNGSVDSLEDWIDELRLDFRTVIVAAGFGNDVHAHESWFPKGLGLEGKPPISERAAEIAEDLKWLRQLKSDMEKRKEEARE